MSAKRSAETCSSEVFLKCLGIPKSLLVTGQSPGVFEMSYAKSTAGCDSRLKAMEVRDSLNPSYPVPPYSPLLYRSEHISVKLSDMECRISPYLKETPTAMASLTTTTLPCMPNKIGEKLEAGASDGRHLRTIAPTFERLEMQFSEACQKSFIVFDHSASKRRFIVHPALLNDHSVFLPNTSKDIVDFSGHLQDISDRAMLSTPSQADPSTRRARLLAYRETMDSAFAALQRMRAEGFCSSGSTEGDGLVAYPNTAEEAESTSRISGNEVYQDHSGGTQSLLHEDTEDLEALLSSDDEVSSTSQSPSEGTSNNIPTLSGDSKNHSSTVSSKRRRLDECDPEEDAEADSCSSEADSGQVLVSDCQFKSPDVSRPAIESWESLTHCNSVGDPKCRESFVLGGSMMSISKQASSRNSGTKYNHARKSSKKVGGLVKRSRKNKIKKTVQLLRDIIRGGDCMDTAAVLDEAIQYVKSLQVEVQKLEAKKFI